MRRGSKCTLVKYDGLCSIRIKSSMASCRRTYQYRCSTFSRSIFAMAVAQLPLPITAMLPKSYTIKRTYACLQEYAWKDNRWLFCDIHPCSRNFDVQMCCTPQNGRLTTTYSPPHLHLLILLNVPSFNFLHTGFGYIKLILLDYLADLLLNLLGLNILKVAYKIISHLL